MEGCLWKWTNYWNGWQIRWFVLNNGILAYYKSQEDVNSGCKGSINVSTCQIEVPANDATRINISIPGEQQQHMYLRASTSQERQQWIVALGSAKACVTSLCRVQGDTNSVTSKMSEIRLYRDLLMQMAHQIKQSVASTPPDVEKLTEAAEQLSVTCDTFTQSLEECVKILDTRTPYEYPHQNVTDVGIVPGRPHKVKPVKAPIKRSPSYETSERKT